VADEVPLATGDFTAGVQVAGYRLAEQIGWGGMAVVYRALDVRLDRWVALKILAPEIARDESFRQRFISESRAAAAVDHPHIIPVFEAGEVGRALFIAMRFVGGGDVGTLVRCHGPLDPARAAGIIAQVASALDAAHAVGLVHRDVKPANMLLAPAAVDSVSPDHVYLADFGLSRQALSAAGPILAGQFVGTLDYMAPEQIKHRPVDGRADLYALACTAFEMLAGQPPFRRAGDAGLMWAQLAEAPPLLTALRSDLPQAVDQVLMLAMSKSPAERPRSCTDFAAALVRACGLEWSATGQLLAGRARAGRQLTVYPTDRSRPATAKLEVAGLRLIERPPDGLGPDMLEPVNLGPVNPGPVNPGPGEPGLDGRAPDRRLPDGRDRDGLASDGTGRHWRKPVIALPVLVVILAVLSAAFLALRSGTGPSRHAAGAAPSAATGPGSTSAPGGHSNLISPAEPGRASRAARPAGPAATVRSYVAAINRHDYRRAWHLGGRNSSPSYATFAQGFGSTATDSLIILSVDGNVVTARLVAVHTDGSIETYQGTYAVEDGVITEANVAQIG
jgi:Protein kinase domain